MKLGSAPLFSSRFVLRHRIEPSYTPESILDDRRRGACRCHDRPPVARFVPGYTRSAMVGASGSMMDRSAVPFPDT